MSLPTMSGTGRLTEDPSIRYAASGTAVLTVNLAFNSRKRQDDGTWVDDAVFFVRATAFKQLAESAGESLSKGDEVVVTGRLKTESWEDRNGGGKRSATALLLDSIGPNLAFATAKVNKVSRSGGSGGTADTGAASGAADDPWSNTGANSGQDQQEDPF